MDYLYKASFSITSVSKMEEVEAALGTLDKNALIVFDIDRTILMMTDQALIRGTLELKKRLDNYPKYNLLSPSSKQIILSAILQNTSHQIIEKTTADLIRTLQHSKIKVILCTTLETGAFGLIPDMVSWRVETLQRLGLSFSAAFPEIQELRLFSEDIHNSPTFKEGVLVTSKMAKGDALKLFLDQINWHPNKLFMIDDKVSQLESVIRALTPHGIDFRGFEYNFIQLMLKDQALDEVLVDYQLKYLLDHRIWLTDEEASAQLYESASP